MGLDTTATFIGHNECYGINRADIMSEIEILIHIGVTNFLNGGQSGFNRLCAGCVYELKEKYPHIKNILVIPYLTFNVFNKEIFDSIVFPDGFEKYHFKAAIPARNRYLVDNSKYTAVCYVDHGWGGAAKTYERAVKKKLEIINLGRYAIE